MSELKMGPMNVKINPLGMLVFTLLGLCLLYYIYTSAFGAERKVESRHQTAGGDNEYISLKQLLAVCIEVSQRGGDEARKVREGNSDDMGEKSKGKTKEGANNPVTNGDIMSHRAMFYGIRKVFPTVNIVSEEHDMALEIPDVSPPHIAIAEVDRNIHSDKTVAMDDVTVWIDPLDATQEYTENLLEYVTTMVCVAVGGKPVMGIIHMPFRKQQTVWAWDGVGASDTFSTMQEERREKMNKRKDVAAAAADSTTPADVPRKIIVSRSHAGDVKKVLSASFGNSTEVIPAGGAGYKSLRVLDGTASAYVHVTAIKKWDICAGNVILNHARGRMTDLNGDSISYSRHEPVKNEKGLLASIGIDHDKILELIPTPTVHP